MNEKKCERSTVRFKIFVENEISSAFFSSFSKTFVESSKKKIKIVVVAFSVVRVKSFTKDKTFQYFDNFVKISLICVKIRRSALFNSSMISTISFVEKYDLVNTVTIIVNRLSVSMSVSFRLSVKNKNKIYFRSRENFDLKII